MAVVPEALAIFVFRSSLVFYFSLFLNVSTGGSVSVTPRRQKEGLWLAVLSVSLSVSLSMSLSVSVSLASVALIELRPNI